MAVAAAPPPPAAPPPAPPGAPAGSPPSDGQPRAYAFRFERGTHKNGVSANAVGNALEFLRKRDGVANARKFVDYSRPEDVETHPLFEWNDQVAAENYRVVQARDTIRELRIVPIGPEAPEAQGPLYVHVKQAQTPVHGYAPAWVVVTRQDWSEQARTECMSQLLGLQRRYRFLQELNPIWNAILAYTNGQSPVDTPFDRDDNITDPDQDQLDNGI